MLEKRKFGYVVDNLIIFECVPGKTLAATDLDGAGNTHGLLLTENEGVWRSGVQAPLPAGAATNPNVRLASVSCAPPATCSLPRPAHR